MASSEVTSRGENILSLEIFRFCRRITTATCRKTAVFSAIAAVNSGKILLIQNFSSACPARASRRRSGLLFATFRPGTLLAQSFAPFPSVITVTEDDYECQSKLETENGQDVCRSAGEFVHLGCRFFPTAYSGRNIQFEDIGNRLRVHAGQHGRHGSLKHPGSRRRVA